MERGDQALSCRYRRHEQYCPARSSREPDIMAEYRTVKAASLTDVVRGIVKAGGSSDREADLVATNLVEANLKGHDSHGVGMVPRYIDAMKEGDRKSVV